MSPKPDPIYQEKNAPLFEAIYGKNLISLGGLDAVDNMFSDLDLMGLKVLDLGFGLGGVAFYLAKKYQIEVAGIEVHPWMVKWAEAHAPKDIIPLLTFAVYNEAGEIPFKTASFDLVYSKGVLNHVRDKDNLFLHINKLLKQDGLFVIADWICLESGTKDSGPLVNETQASYQHVLEKTGFTDIRFRDDSMIFLGYVKKLLETLLSNKETIEQEYGKEIFSVIWNDHQKLVEDINQKRKFAVRIVANKK
jgi:ubiquinone/menaquinone biosynthesis C-methylase UbiE